MRKRLFAVVLVCVAALCRDVAAEPWMNLAPLNQARQEVAVAALGDKVYVIGGFAGLAIVDTVEVWNPAQDTWSNAAPLPTVVHHAAAVGLGGTLYVLGGWTDFFNTPTAAVWAYDPGSNLWSPRAPLPLPRASLAAAAVGGKIYAAGGWPLARSQDFAVYDPVADAWAPLPNLPTARNHLAAAAYGGRFYAIAGRSDLGAGEANVNVVEEYDLLSDTWRTRAPLPSARSGLAAATIGPFIFAVGGEGNGASGNGTFPDNDAFSPAANTWTPVTGIPIPVHGIGAAVLAGHMHVPGGGPIEGFSTTDLHQVYDPATDPLLPNPVRLWPAPFWVALALLSLGLLWIRTRRV